MGRALTNARVGFDGQVDGTDVTGSLSRQRRPRRAGDAASPATSPSRATTARSRASSSPVGPNRLTGDLAKSGTAPIDGRLTLHAPDIAPLASLALVEATGALDADI